MSTILVLVSTALNSNVAIIIRYLRKLHVASLTSSREIVFIIITFITIFLIDVQLKTPNLMDKLKIVMIGENVLLFISNIPNNCWRCFLLGDAVPHYRGSQGGDCQPRGRGGQIFCHRHRCPHPGEADIDIGQGQPRHNVNILKIIFFDLIPNSWSIAGMILVLVAGVLQSGWKYYKEVKTKP